MLNTRKLIPFALAAGLMGGAAAANDDNYTLTYEKPDDSPFTCTQQVFYTKEGIYRFAHKCPNTAGSVLIAHHALARMDWQRAFAENATLLRRGLTERPVIEGLLKSGLMRADMTDAAWAAGVAEKHDVETPSRALIDAVRAAQKNDSDGVMAALTRMNLVRGEPESLYINNLAYVLDTHISGGTGGNAAQLLAAALADTDAMIREQVKTAIARDGKESAEAYAAFNDAATMMRRAGELLLDPQNHEARRALARFYIEKQATEAGKAMMDAIPEEVRTPEDRGLIMLLREPVAPKKPVTLPPIPRPIPY